MYSFIGTLRIAGMVIGVCGIGVAINNLMHNTPARSNSQVNIVNHDKRDVAIIPAPVKAVAQVDDFAQHVVAVENDPKAGPFRWGVWQAAGRGATGPGQCNLTDIVVMHAANETGTCTKGLTCKSFIRTKHDYLMLSQNVYIERAGITKRFERSNDGRTVTLVSAEYHPELDIASPESTRRAMAELIPQLPRTFYRCS